MKRHRKETPAVYVLNPRTPHQEWPLTGSDASVHFNRLGSTSRADASRFQLRTDRASARSHQVLYLQSSSKSLARRNRNFLDPDRTDNLVKAYI